MAILGSLNLLFKADTRKASKRIKSFGKVVRGIDSSINGLKSSLLGLGAGLAGAFTLGSIFGKAQEISNTTMELEKWANALGISSAKLSAMNSVGRQFGITNDRMNDAMKDLNERIADAVSGGTTYEEAFNRMGLKSKDLIKLPVAEQFTKVTIALSKLNTQADKNFVGAELMADAGFDLINMADQLGDSLADVFKKQEGSQFAITDEDILRVTSLNKTFLNIGNDIDNVFTKSLGDSSISLSILSNQYNDFFKGILTTGNPFESMSESFVGLQGVLVQVSAFFGKVFAQVALLEEFDLTRSFQSDKAKKEGDTRIKNAKNELRINNEILKQESEGKGTLFRFLNEKKKAENKILEILKKQKKERNASLDSSASRTLSGVGLKDIKTFGDLNKKIESLRVASLTKEQKILEKITKQEMFIVSLKKLGAQVKAGSIGIVEKEITRLKKTLSDGKSTKLKGTKGLDLEKKKDNLERINAPFIALKDSLKTPFEKFKETLGGFKSIRNSEGKGLSDKEITTLANREIKSIGGSREDAVTTSAPTFSRTFDTKNLSLKAFSATKTTDVKQLSFIEKMEQHLRDILENALDKDSVVAVAGT